MISIRRSGRKQARILAVPNEDGLGPSALLSHMVRTLLRRVPGAQVTVWNRAAFDYNCSLYSPEIAAGRVTVKPVSNLLVLAKPGGRVSMEATLVRAGNYRQLTRQYPGFEPEPFDLVLDFNAPAAAAWARRCGIPSLSMGDHAWSLTLEQIAADSGGGGAAWRDLIAALCEDEALVERILLFPPFITPEWVRTYWTGLLGANRVAQLGAVLGGRPELDRAKALNPFGFSRPGRTLLLHGGGTPAWDLILPRIATDLRAAELSGQLEAQNINAALYLPQHVDLQLDPNLFRVRRLEPLAGGTLQQVLPDVDLLVTRAGGGSVNDAIACRTPFVCLGEQGMPQVEGIRQACLAHGLTLALEAGEFAAHPLDTILSVWESAVGLKPQLEKIPTSGEEEAVEKLITTPGISDQ